MELGKYKFGYADATKEFMIEPEIFESAFYDPRNILNHLLKGWKYMIIGRKGVGKSAFSSKIQSIANSEKEFVAYPIQLNDFEYTTFGKASSDSDLVGTKKYLEAWEFIILINTYKILYEHLKIREVKEFNDMINILNRLGFPIAATFKMNVALPIRSRFGYSSTMDTRFCFVYQLSQRMMICSLF